MTNNNYPNKPAMHLPGNDRPANPLHPINGWSVRRHTVAGITGILLGLTVILIFIVSAMMRQLADHHETAINREALERALLNISSTTESIEKVARDYGAWEEAWNFVEGRNPGFKASYLHDTGLTNMGITYIAYLNGNNQVVYSRHTGHRENPAAGKALIRDFPVLLSTDARMARKSGLAVVDGTLMFTCSAPILDSKFTPPPHGRIIVGLDVDSELSGSFTRHTGIPTEFIRLDKPDSFPDGTRQATAGLTTKNQDAAVALPHDVMALIHLLTDISGRPVAALHLTIHRDTRVFYKQWSTAFHAAILILVLAAILAIMWRLKKSVLAPLEELDRGIGLIAASGPSSFRFTGLKEGEFGILADGINRMLDSIVAMQSRAAESEASYRELVETANSIILKLDTTGAVTFINYFGQTFFEFSSEEITGKKALGTIYPESDSAGGDQTSLFADISAHPATNASIEVENMTRTGRRVRVAWTNRVIHAHDGTETGLLCVGNDVTGQREMEKELSDAREEVGNLHKMEALGRMAGGIAHDFNNILAVISGYTDMIAEKAADDPKFSRYASEIQKAVERAGNLSGQLLVLSRKQATDARIIDPGAVVAETCRMLAGMLGENTALSYLAGPDIPLAKIDPAQLQQVVISIAMNSRDAMPAGGTITMRTTQAEIRPGSARFAAGVPAGPASCISIEDTGTGMGADVLAHLFEPFFTTKPKGHGIGMGLSMVYAIIRKAHGLVEVESREGRGTTIRIVLPGHAAEPADTAPPASLLDISSRGETLLVVEDHSDLRDLAREILEKQGYQVLLAEDGQAGLEVASDLARPIDLVLTDIVMPRLNGREMAERLKNIRPGLRIAYMSGYTAEASSYFEGQDGRIIFLAKPFSTRQLLETVRRGLDQEPA